MKNHGVDHGNSPCSMYPSATFLSRTSFMATSSGFESGYILQLIVAGAPSFSIMARSSGCDGGNLFAASSEKTTSWRLYCFGSSVVAWSLVVALAHSWAKFVFANSSFFCHHSCHSCHASRTVSKLIVLSIVLFAQSMWGFEFCSQGNPKIALSHPRLVT